MITNIRHTTIVVRKMDKALFFFRDLLGLKIVVDAVKKGSEEKYIDAMMGSKDIVLRVVKMKPLNGDTLLELIEFKSPEAEYES